MVDAAELPCKKTRSDEPWQVVTPVTDWGRMIRGSPTLAKVLVGLFYGVPSMAATLWAVAARR